MKYKTTHRGNLYKFEDPLAKGQRYVVVVSNEFRNGDKLANILLTHDFPMGSDAIEIAVNEDGELRKKYIHCTGITYCTKDKIGECIGAVDKETMREIDFKIESALGLTDGYKYTVLLEQYNKLLERYMEKDA